MARPGDAVLSKVGLVALVLLVGGVGAVAFVRTRPDPEPKFCTLGLPLWGTLDGVSVSLEDHAEPGRGDCDGEDHLRDMVVVGFDCKVRTGDGDVIDEVEPNRGDECGQPDAGDELPASWGIDPP